MAISKSRAAVGLGVAGLLVLVLGIVLVFVRPLIIDDQIIKNVEINPKNDLSYTMWKDIPVPFFMSVYFFNILNPDEILNGEKPLVEERGPYVYREYRQKDNITFHANKTVSYREYRQYHFVRNMSVGNESDMVTIPNMLVLFNNSNTGLFTVFTGQDDIRKVHKVDSWNGVKELSYWRTKQCNMINGTAGQMWPPFMTTESTLPFYSPDACRSMELVYQRPGVLQGIPVYRFVAPTTLFANGSDYTPNEGFCPCRQSGIQNVSTCRLNAPVFISHPHFYNGDPVLRDYVRGLDPSEDKHGLFIDIHPDTGVPMNVSIRLQLNLYIKAVSGIKQTGNISEVVMPMIWFEEKGYIDGPVLTTFYRNLVLMPTILEYLQYVLIGLGLLALVGAVLLCYWEKKRSSEEFGPSRPVKDPMTSATERTPLLQNGPD